MSRCHGHSCGPWNASKTCLSSHPYGLCRGREPLLHSPCLRPPKEPKLVATAAADPRESTKGGHFPTQRSSPSRQLSLAPPPDPPPSDWQGCQLQARRHRRSQQTQRALVLQVSRSARSTQYLRPGRSRHPCSSCLPVTRPACSLPRKQPSRPSGTRSPLYGLPRLQLLHERCLVPSPRGCRPKPPVHDPHQGPSKRHADALLSLRSPSSLRALPLQ
mmetsp:Transcript_8094/g.30398  ORF Transcript_8094/g.30398 Transcript_8094/m.30398 type:complete len:217 (+) Transcript_8094:872-1522(+)